MRIVTAVAIWLGFLLVVGLIAGGFGISIVPLVEKPLSAVVSLLAVAGIWRALSPKAKSTGR